MARTRALKYFYRALFKPDSLDAFEGFSQGIEDGKGLGYAQAWHKANTEWSPYVIYNEFICGELGRAIRLPIPPFAITHHGGGRTREALFSSLDFNFSRANLPRIIPDICAKAMLSLCTGVLVFDILIANEDRHDENLLVDNVARPREMYIYDHEQSLLGGCNEQGIPRLQKLRDRLGITGSTVTGGNQHVFLPVITTCKYIARWAKRIRDIPDWFIVDICSEARSLGLERNASDACADFITHRKASLSNLIDSHRSSFAIDDWPPRQRSLLP